MDKKRSTHQFWKLTGIFIETFIVNNIVLIQAIGICPIIAVGTNLKYGVALTLCTAAVLLPTSLFMSLYGDKLPAAARPPVYTLGASAPAGWGGLSGRPLHFHRAVRLAVPVSAPDGGQHHLHLPGGRLFGEQPARCRPGGRFGLGLRLRPGHLRRFRPAGAGHFRHPMGQAMGFDLRLPEAAQPFAAFILLGFMAAFLQWIKAGVSHFFQRKEEESR